MHWQEVWEGQGLGAKLLRVLLLPASWLYALGWLSYLAIYQFGFKRARTFHTPVICVGNLQVGGTGKTPFVIYLGELLREAEQEVVISCSGYGGAHYKMPALAPQGALDPRVWGDEPAEIRERLPDIPIVVAKDRVAASKIVSQRHPGAIMLLDDGFQHLPLLINVSILLDPVGPNSHCLPAGPYREPKFCLNRGMVVIPRDFTLEATRTNLESPDGKICHPKSANVLCAIARPLPFLEDLDQIGVSLNRTRCLPDHDPLTAGNLFEGMDPKLPLIVTAKDWVKLQSRPDIAIRIVLIARRSIRVKEEAEFLKRILDEINGS